MYAQSINLLNAQALVVDARVARFGVRSAHCAKQRARQSEAELSSNTQAAIFFFQ